MKKEFVKIVILVNSTLLILLIKYFYNINRKKHLYKKILKNIYLFINNI